MTNKFKHNDGKLRVLDKSRTLEKNNIGSSKVDYLSNFVFNLCSENSNTEGYCTEKLMDCVTSGCIPIYWGDNENEKIFNQNRIIKVDTNKLNSLDDAIMTIKHMITDKEQLKNFFEQPVFSKDAQVYVDEFIYKSRLVAELYVDFAVSNSHWDS